MSTAILFCLLLSTVLAQTPTPTTCKLGTTPTCSELNIATHTNTQLVQIGPIGDINTPTVSYLIGTRSTGTITISGSEATKTNIGTNITNVLVGAIPSFDANWGNIQIGSPTEVQTIHVRNRVYGSGGNLKINGGSNTGNVTIRSAAANYAIFVRQGNIYLGGINTEIDADYVRLGGGTVNIGDSISTSPIKFGGGTNLVLPPTTEVNYGTQQSSSASLYFMNQGALTIRGSSTVNTNSPTVQLGGTATVINLGAVAAPSTTSQITFGGVNLNNRLSTSVHAPSIGPSGISPTPLPGSNSYYQTLNLTSLAGNSLAYLAPSTASITNCPTSGPATNPLSTLSSDKQVVPLQYTNAADCIHLPVAGVYRICAWAKTDQTTSKLALLRVSCQGRMMCSPVSTGSPTKKPTTTNSPTDSPTTPTKNPSKNPTSDPTTGTDTNSPTLDPTKKPTKNPTSNPTTDPTTAPLCPSTPTPTPLPTPFSESTSECVLQRVFEYDAVNSEVGGCGIIQATTSGDQKAPLYLALAVKASSVVTIIGGTLSGGYVTVEQIN